VQSEILESFQDDFSKYKPSVDPLCLNAVFLNAAKRVGEQIKYTKLNQGHSGQTNRKAFALKKLLKYKETRGLSINLPF